MDYYQNMIQATNEKNSFMLHNGIRLTKMERDHAVVEADLTRVNRNLYGAAVCFSPWRTAPPAGPPEATGCVTSR